MSGLTYQYAHKAKLENKKRVGKRKLTVAEAALVKSKLETYALFVTELNSVLQTSDFVSLATLINAYMDEAKAYENSAGTLFTSGSKYYSSILEELPVHFVKPTIDQYCIANPLADRKAITVGNCACVIRIGANPDGSQFQETKSIDFAIAVSAQGLQGNIYVPLLGLEVKRYMDKTMFGTVLETYKSLAIFRPRTFYGFVVEDESRGADVVLNSQMHRTEFHLTGCARPENDSDRNPILAPNLERFVKAIQAASIEALQSTKVT